MASISSSARPFVDNQNLNLGARPGRGSAQVKNKFIDLDSTCLGLFIKAALFIPNQVRWGLGKMCGALKSSCCSRRPNVKKAEAPVAASTHPFHRLISEIEEICGYFPKNRWDVAQRFQEKSLAAIQEWEDRDDCRNCASIGDRSFQITALRDKIIGEHLLPALAFLEKNELDLFPKESDNRMLECALESDEELRKKETRKAQKDAASDFTRPVGLGVQRVQRVQAGNLDLDQKYAESSEPAQGESLSVQQLNPHIFKLIHFNRFYEARNLIDSIGSLSTRKTLLGSLSLTALIYSKTFFHAHIEKKNIIDWIVEDPLLGETDKSILLLDLLEELHKAVADLENYPLFSTLIDKMKDPSIKEDAVILLSFRYLEQYRYDPSNIIDLYSKLPNAERRNKLLFAYGIARIGYDHSILIDRYTKLVDEKSLNKYSLPYTIGRIADNTDRTHALKAAGCILNDPKMQSEAYAKIVDFDLKNRNIDHALEDIELIQNADLKAEKRADIAVAQVEAQKLKDGLNTARSIGLPSGISGPLSEVETLELTRAFGSVANDQIKRGRSEQAFAIGRAIPDAAAASAVTASASRLELKRKDPVRAREMALEIPDVNMRDEVLADVADGFAARNPLIARQIAGRQISNPALRERVNENARRNHRKRLRNGSLET